MQILVIEDEKRLAEALQQLLSEKKYMVELSFDCMDGLSMALSGIYDVIVLDVMLPKMNGLQVVGELRKAKVETPVLMLTAKDQVNDKVAGLDAGADDYMTKPFAPIELFARINALTRRQGEVIIDKLTFSDTDLNLSTCDLCCNDKSVHLNYKESEIMKILMSNPGKVTTKDELIVKVWGYDSNAVDNNVEVYISFLRKKLDFIGSSAQIVSLRKIGYRLEVK